MEHDDQRRLNAVTAAARRLRVDYAAATAIRALEGVSIRCIVLKGPSVARWLYEPDDARIYADCDLLVAPAQFQHAAAVLGSVGFKPELDEAAMPLWWREHALTTVRASDGTMIDLHRTLPGVQVADELAWTILSRKTVPIGIGEVTAHALTEAGRALHIALHAAQHAGSARDLDVLARAIGRVDERTWRAAADLAGEMEATAAFVRGLHFLPAGARLAETLSLSAPKEIEVELRATGAVEALTFARLFAVRSLRLRLSLIATKLVPPPTFMRKWSPLARRGRLGLAVAYVWRPLWVLSRLPAAASAYARARNR